MAEYGSSVTSMEGRPLRFSWSSVFAGTFVFLAIEATLVALGIAIFTSAAHVRAGWVPGPGFTVYATIISIIALYFGGRAAGALCGAWSRGAGMYHGLVTFGMSVFASLLIAALALGSTVTVAAASNASPQRIADLLTAGGWGLFIALILGLIGAAMGAAGEVSAQLRTRPATGSQTLHPAA